VVKHRLLVIGAGRIGAGFRWHDDAYTHAGAAKALENRVELVGFVEPNPERADATTRKWGVLAYERLGEALNFCRPDIVSVCVQPEDQDDVMWDLPPTLKGVWCEKPFMCARLDWPWPVQVNYLRRADKRHSVIADDEPCGRLVVYAKDDIHTVCHFKDLQRWWRCQLDYRVYGDPCAYVYQTRESTTFFDNGGVEPGECMKAMLGNLIDVVEKRGTLWSPPY